MAQTMLSDGELAAVDDWRFANRIASRSEAIRRLIARGLEVEGASGVEPEATTKGKRARPNAVAKSKSQSKGGS